MHNVATREPELDNDRYRLQIFQPEKVVLVPGEERVLSLGLSVRLPPGVHGHLVLDEALVELESIALMDSVFGKNMIHVTLAVSYFSNLNSCSSHVLI